MPNLLVITNWYPQIWTNRYHCNFVKEFTEIVSEDFDNIYVICPQPYFPKILRNFKVFEEFYRCTNFKNFNYKNIKVFFPTYFTLPISYFRKNNRKFWLKKVLNTINRENINFEIIHCHFLNQSWIIWAELKKVCKEKKVIVHCHDSTLKKDLTAYPEKYKSIFKLVDNTISFCEHYEVINSFEKINKIDNKNIYIPNFVNTNKFYPKNNRNELRKKYWFNSDDKILICIWNLIYEHKWQNDILAIWKDLENEIKNLHLILIWDWPDKEKMLSTIKILNTDKIHYLWPKNNEEIVDFLNISDLFIFPSRYESFWISPIEAISCWTPVIAYKNWGTEYIINDDKIWTILNEQNINLLHKWILDMLNTKYDRKYLHNYITSRYSWDIIKDKLRNIYKL